MSVSLCFLTWNELEGCRNDVPSVPMELFDQVFCLDNGSTDGTVEFMQERGIEVIRQKTKSYNGAYIDAFNACTSDYLVLFHPKGSIDPESLHKMKKEIDEGHDLIVASRIMKGARNEEDSKIFKPRKWFVISLGLFGELIWRSGQGRALDVLHGYRAMKKSSFFAISPLEQGTSIDLEMVWRSRKLGMKLAEFPVQEKERLAGTTHFPMFKTGWKILKYVWFEIWRPKHPRSN